MIEFLQAKYNLLNPDEYEHKIINGSLRQTDICLSFDDALKSQVAVAAPVLKDADIRAYFFVYSAAFGDSPPLQEYSRDFRNSFACMEDFYKEFFAVIAERYPLQFKTFLEIYPDDYLAEFPFYSDNDRKYRFLRDKILKAQYSECVQSMMSKHGYSIEQNTSKLFMSTQDLQTLHDFGHQIGLHSSSHPTELHTLSYQDQEYEYRENLTFLENLLDTKITSMAHPCGNYSSDTLTILQKLGINIGFRSSLSPTTITSNLEIPREDHANLMKWMWQ
jgi:peptidoglycan/xylan/chitin deacetylase (PgdA/CDA1 family)